MFYSFVQCFCTRGPRASPGARWTVPSYSSFVCLFIYSCPIVKPTVLSPSSAGKGRMMMWLCAYSDIPVEVAEDVSVFNIVLDKSIETTGSEKKT